MMTHINSPHEINISARRPSLSTTQAIILTPVVNASTNTQITFATVNIEITSLEDSLRNAFAFLSFVAVLFASLVESLGDCGKPFIGLAVDTFEIVEHCVYLFRFFLS